MNVISGVIGLPKRNRELPIDRCSVDSFNLKLTNDTWMIGIDQSTTNSGIALISAKLDFVILLDLHRDKNLEKKIFYRDFFYLLRKLVDGKNIKLLVLEKPVPSKYRNAGNVLRELKGHLDDWIEMIPEFENTYLGELYPQSWKSVVVNTGKGKNRFNDKQAIASDLVDMFPCLERYYLTYPYSDYDSFDALGILLGYLQLAFDSDGNPAIYSSTEKKHVSFVCYKEVKKSELDDPMFLHNLFGMAYGQFKPEFRSFNSRFSLYKNIRMASSSGKNFYTMIPRTEYTQFQWKFGVDPDDKEKVLLMFIFRRGNLSRSDANTLKSIFEWNEDVYGEE